MITDFYVADAEIGNELMVSGAGLRPALSTSNADNSVLAELWTALDPDADAASLSGEACLVASADSGPWVFELPKALVASLAQLEDDAAERVCGAWAQGEEMRYHGVSGSDLARPLNDLREVALNAVESGKSVLLKMSL